MRIGAIFIVGALGALGIALPFTLPLEKGESSLFKCLKANAAGVMLGLALMHLLPDADEDLRKIMPNYGLAFALTAAGVVLNLLLEQVALIWLASNSVRRGTGSSGDSETPYLDERTGLRSHEHDEKCGFVPCDEMGESKSRGSLSYSDTGGVSAPSRLSRSNQQSQRVRGGMELESGDQCQHHCISDQHQHGDAQMIGSLLDAEGLRETVSLYAMELTVSVHSLIIGLDIGFLSGAAQIPTLFSLVCAISFHQFVEGLGLGTILRGVSENASSAAASKVLVFACIFCVTCPCGILLGILTSTMQPSPLQLFVKGAANALAAGSLLYISLAEMVAHYFSAVDVFERPVLKLQMVLIFSMGILAMAVLAIWA
eukprot:CAMPEP_0173199244 /NCGR_PEP_ID=MMETSP1141-20130122/17131_1 /TAXON_ID=483371 /ORGANISM="non described non described, Strain CCMP2298" /LENGTH=370 /DNA_ID=CAMNT_0014124119 /DNA_START=152 /DNA_END=1264 /DNA_ORIENTATION=+